MAGRPIAVGNKAHVKAAHAGLVNAVQQDRVEEKNLPTLEIDGVYGAVGLRFVQEMVDLNGRHRPRLPGTAPGEAVIAFQRTLVGE